MHDFLYLLYLTIKIFLQLKDFKMFKWYSSDTESYPLANIS